MLTSWGVRARGLTDGQVVTLLTGIGLDLLRRHAIGVPYGPIHPAHIRLDESRRPRLVPVPTTRGWTPHDDWVSLLRLGRAVAAGPWASQVSAAAGRREGLELLRWLVSQVAPEPLPASVFAGVGPISGSRGPDRGARRARW